MKNKISVPFKQAPHPFELAPLWTQKISNNNNMRYSGIYSDLSLALPRFSMVPTNKTVKETEHALLNCFTSSSDTNITWFKDGKALTGDKFAFLRSGLLILRAGRPDKDWYACNATNKAGSKVARAYLNVREPLDSG